MKYFLHDTSAFQDEKISQLFINFGYEGIGLFFTLLEKIALQEKPVNSSVLKKQLYIGKRLEKCWNFMEEIGLICTKNDETFNENILNFSEKYQIKKEKTRMKVSEWRDKQKDAKIVTSYKNIRNQPKVKESKVKVSNIYIPEFSEFLSYAVEKKPNIDKENLRLKYEAWKINDWKNGNSKPIKNWKSTLLNTLPYIKENQIKQYGTPEPYDPTRGKKL